MLAAALLRLRSTAARHHQRTAVPLGEGESRRVYFSGPFKLTACSAPPPAAYGAPRGGGGDWGNGGFRGGSGRGGYGGSARGGGNFDRNGYGNPNSGGKGGSGAGSFANGVHTPGPADPRAERELFGVETRQTSGINFVCYHCHGGNSRIILIHCRKNTTISQ